MYYIYYIYTCLLWFEIDSLILWLAKKKSNIYFCAYCMAMHVQIEKEIEVLNSEVPLSKRS